MSATPASAPLSLRARLCAAALSISAATLVVTVPLQTRAGFSSRLGMTTAGVFLLAMAVALGGIGRSHPFPRLGPANWITMIRTALVALVAALLAEPRAPLVAHACVVVASVAAALDGWDGWLARRTRMSSPFGARFDMEVDAFLILLLGFFVWRYDKAGAWVLLSGALRYLFVLAGWALPWFERPLPPSMRRKAVCVIQIVGLIVASSPLIPRPLSALSAGLTLVLLVWSFAVDTAWLWRHRYGPELGVLPSDTLS